MPLAADSPPSPTAPRRLLSAGDAASIVVGIIIGSSIFETAPTIAGCVSDTTTLVAIWVFGGLIALAGALCYAELGAAWPHAGGTYVYLSRAFSPRLGFLFAWTDLWVVRPGSIGFMAFVFGRYAQQLVPVGNSSQGRLIYAVGAIVVLSAVNGFGVRESKWTQNLLTAAKLLGLAAVIVVAFASPGATAPAVTSAAAHETNYFLALILVMFAYGGWSDVAYVAAEVRNPRNDILKSLVVGVGVVTAAYVAVNLAYVWALGFAGLTESKAVAADAVGSSLGNFGRIAISLLICISALGAIHGQIFTGARMFYALGHDQPLLARLGRWNVTFGTPVTALVVQAAATLIPTVCFAFAADGAERLIIFTTPFWAFIALVAAGLVVLRYTEPSQDRPYRVWGYPFTPILFCLSSLFLLVAAGMHAVRNFAFEVYIAAGVVALGAALMPLARGKCADGAVAANSPR